MINKGYLFLKKTIIHFEPIIYKPLDKPADL